VFVRHTVALVMAQHPTKAQHSHHPNNTIINGQKAHLMLLHSVADTFSTTTKANILITKIICGGLVITGVSGDTR